MSHPRAKLTVKAASSWSSACWSSAGACRWPPRPKVLAGHRLQVDPSVPGRRPRGLRDRSSRPHRSPARLSPAREAAILPAPGDARGTAPDRLGARGGAFDRAPGAPSPRCATAARPRSPDTHRRPLRARTARRARARRHQEAGQDPRGRWLADPWTGRHAGPAPSRRRLRLHPRRGR